jgi:hypothetical protein
LADQTQLNPGVGGDIIATEDPGLGYKLPVSKIRLGALDVDGGDVTPGNPLPVGGVNPATGAALAPSVVPAGGLNEQAVYDARAASARDELRVNMQAIVDLFTTSVLQVAAKIAGQPAGAPDATNVLPVQGVAGGTPVQTNIVSLAGMATVFPAGELRAQLEPTQLFLDAFDTTVFDTVNRWNAPVLVGGGQAVTNTQASVLIASGTTANGYAILTSQPTFRPSSPGFLQFLHTVNIETPTLLNAYRFWGGIAAIPTTPTTAVPLTDAAGWEVAPDGKLYAVTYAGGGRNLIGNVPQVHVDGKVHKYFLYYRGELAYWAIDTLENIVAVNPTGALGPNNNIFVTGGIAIAGPTPPTSSAQLNFNAVWVADTSGAAAPVTDSQYPWRAARVTAPGAAPIAGDGALVVALSPNAPIALDESGAPGLLPLGRGSRVQLMLDRENSAQNAAIIAKLDAILFVLMQMGGVSPPANDPAFTLTQ